jgi:hypothetical protein
VSFENLDNTAKEPARADLFPRSSIVFFRLPEPAGRTYGELDILFERKIPARLFSKTEVDEFEAAERDAANNAAGGGHAIAH